MADKKISQLTALSAANVASATDVLAIVDTSATETKKITAKDLIDGALNGGTANGVLYLNGSKVATSGSALVFDGTNLGLGVTPSAWRSLETALQYGGVGALSSYNSITTNFRNNCFINSSNAEKYIANGYALIYNQNKDTGVHAWLNAASGTAGNTISFTQAMTLSGTSDANLLLGTTSAAYSTSGRGLFEVNGSSSALIAIKSGDTARGYFAAGSTATELAAVGASQPLLFTTNSNERGRFSAGGYFKASNSGTYVNSTGTYHEFNSDDGDDAVLFVRASEGAYSGNVLIPYATRNTTNNSFYYISCYNSGSSTDRFRVADSGNVTNTNGSYGTISDVKMKTDIVDAGSQWDDIKAVRFRKFKMKDDPDQIVQLGVVAQELEQTSPGLVDEHQDYEEFEVTDNDGNATKKRRPTGTSTKSVKTSVLLMKAAAALQEAMARIESLEADVAALKGAK